MEKDAKAKVNVSRQKKIALVVLILVILVSLEGFAHTYVQIHGLPVVSEEEVQIMFSNPQYYTGSSAFSSSGCRWLVGWLVRRPAPQNGYVSILRPSKMGVTLF